VKWTVKTLCLLLMIAPIVVSAQTRARRSVRTERPLQELQIGRIPQVDDRSPSTWGMSGMEMIRVTQSIGSATPITRTLTYDARTVEILSRTQAPPLRPRDIRVVSRGGHVYIGVRAYLLLEVMPEDARAEHTSKAALAQKWAARVRRVLPQVAPTPNRFGV
jgi:hypothetical protein